jgi:hypothetical protein
MTKIKIKPYGLRKNRKAVSPAISTVIMTSATIVLILVTVSFANNFVNARMAENEFDAMEQFMQTVGLQIDDVSWTVGRTQTIRYASRFGEVNVLRSALNYVVYVDKGSGYVYFANYTVDILLFNMPVSRYSISNNYHERISPSSDGSFLQMGTSAPVTHVFAVEKMPMSDGSYIRVVVAPTVRMLNSTISAKGINKYYFKFYLPLLLSSGDHLYRSQSVTLMGNEVAAKTEGDVTKVKIHYYAEKTGLGFDTNFFNFENVEEEVDVPSGSVVEFYTGKVVVSIGMHI